MDPNLHFCEGNNIQPAFMPQNLAAGANTGAWVSLKEYYRCAVVFIGAAGAAGQPPTVTLQQSQDISGSSPKALNFTDIRVKEGTSLTAVGQFTAVAQAAANTFTETYGNGRAIWVIDISAEDLDISNGYHAIQASVADVGSTPQYGCCMYVLHAPREAGIDGTLPDPTVN